MISNLPKVFISVVLFIMAVLSAGVNCFANETGRVSGKVVDADTGRGISSVLVTVEAGLEVFTAYTDSVGGFALSTLPAGFHFPISAVKKGYKSVSTTVSIESEITGRIMLALPSHCLKLLYPQGGEHVIAGTDVVIRWEAYGIEHVRFEFSINSGRHWYTLGEVIDAEEGQYVWSVPDLPTKNCMIRIIGRERPSMTDQNNVPFSISSF